MKTLTVTKSTLESILTTYSYCQANLGRYPLRDVRPWNMDHDLHIVGVRTPEKIKPFKIYMEKLHKFNPDQYCDQSFALLECSQRVKGQFIPAVLLPQENTLLIPERILKAYPKAIFDNPDLRVWIFSDLMLTPSAPKCDLSLTEYYGQDLDWMTSGSGYVFERVLREFTKPKKPEQPKADSEKADSEKTESEKKVSPKAGEPEKAETPESVPALGEDSQNV